MSTSTGAVSKSPLDAAQKIVAEIQDMTPEHQLLAIKFAIETLGLQWPSATSGIVQPRQPSAPSSVVQSASPPLGQLGVGHSTDIKAFAIQKSPKSDQQFAAVVAYFYQFEAPPDQRKEVIDVDTMKEAARLAGRKQAPQWRFTLNNATTAGYLNSAGNGKYNLSPVGENLVAITLPGNAGASSWKTARSKAKTSKKKKLPTKKPKKGA